MKRAADAGPPRVVVIGAGFGGLAAARRVARLPVAVTVVDVNNFHTFQPLLYQVATAGLQAGDIAYAARGILRRFPNVDFVMGEVVELDLEGRTVALADGGTLAYDYLIASAGAVTTSYGVEGVERDSFGLKSLADAEALRAHLIGCFEEAARPSVELRGGALDVVVVGGGPTGVELSGGLAELYGRVLARDYPRLPVATARIVLLEAGERLLPGFHPRLSARARRDLGARGVEVHLEAGVGRVDKEGVVLTDGTVIDAGTVVWAAGVAAAPLARRFRTETGRGGRVIVEANLSLGGHPEVFLVGDMAAPPNLPGAPSLPQVAQVAIQGGRHAAGEVASLLAGRGPQDFAYHDKGTMATIGRRTAVCQLPSGVRFTGTLGWLAWLGLHLLYLMGFRNRLSVLLDWTWNYFTSDRAARLVGPGLDARQGQRDVPRNAGRAGSA